MIRIENVEVTYNKGNENEVRALHIPSLHIDSTCWCNIIGPNGSGKTTLLKLLSGGLDSFSGTVHLDGADVTGWRATQFYAHVQLIEQNPENNTVPSMTIQENLQLYASRKRFPALSFLKGQHKKSIKDLLARFDMELEDRLSCQCGLLSGGQKQAIALAGVLLRKPKVLLLDEFLNSIDPETAPRLLSIVKQLSTELSITILMVSHDLEHVVRSGNRIIILSGGRIADDLEIAEHGFSRSSLVSHYSAVLEKEGII